MNKKQRDRLPNFDIIVWALSKKFIYCTFYLTLS